MKKIPILILCVLVLTSISSCRKDSSKVVKSIKEWRAASKSDAIQFLKWKHRFEQAEKVYNNMIYSPCSTCNGTGVVYQIDPYGNIVTDYYGNVQYFWCPSCAGTGNN